MTSQHALAVRDALPLAHLLAARVATESDVRALIIKGPTAAHHGLRDERISADVDIWVDPARYDVYIGALSRFGWRKRAVSTLVEDLVVHSQTLIHSDWPCDIDVHWMFPGFLNDTQVVFETMWARRESLAIANGLIDVVDRDSAVLIAALHALRNPSQTARHGIEYRQLFIRVLPMLSSRERTEIAHLAAQVGCLDTARPLLAALDVPLPVVTPWGHDLELDAWRERTAGHGTSTVQLWSHLRARPWRERPRLLWRAIWPSERDFRIEHYSVPQGRRALNRARLARLARGLSSAPATLRARRAVRRGVTDDAALRRPLP